MKIILSRKGFDASVGKVASPIFPSGELCSLPIPESVPARYSRRYEEIEIGGQSSEAIVNDLTEGNIKTDTYEHLDPDLDKISMPRLGTWQPEVGQSGDAERQ